MIDRERASSQRTRLLEAFKQRRELTGGEMIEMGFHRFGARIFELRREGWDIRLVDNDPKTGKTVYRFIGMKEYSLF